MVIIEYKRDLPKRGRADLQEGQKVALRISERTVMGFIADITGAAAKGILYKNEVFQPLKIGQEIDGFIKKIREDKRIDLCLQQPGYRAIEAQARKIIDRLEQEGGFIAVTDDSPPKLIAQLFGVSKKTYKKAVGHLYKRRLITLEKTGVRLREKAGKGNSNPKKT